MNDIIVALAKYLVLAVVAVSVVLWLRLPRRHRVRAAGTAIFAAAVAIALVQIGSALYESPRPFVTSHVTPLFAHPPDNGFPSDHTVVASLAAFVTLLHRRLWGLVLLALSIVVGTTRVLAHVHHTVDVAGGIAIAAVAVAAGYPASGLTIRRWDPTRAGR